MYNLERSRKSIVRVAPCDLDQGGELLPTLLPLCLEFLNYNLPDSFQSAGQKEVAAKKVAVRCDCFALILLEDINPDPDTDIQ